jgi:hypothetical protein
LLLWLIRNTRWLPWHLIFIPDPLLTCLAHLSQSEAREAILDLESLQKVTGLLN